MLTGFDQFARRFVNSVPSGRRIGTGLFNVVIGIFESRLIAEINSCLYIIHLHHLYNLGLKFFAAIQCKHRMFAICFCNTLKNCRYFVALVQFQLLCFKHSHDAMGQFSSNKTVHLKRQRGNSVLTCT